MRIFYDPKTALKELFGKIVAASGGPEAFRRRTGQGAPNKLGAKAKAKAKARPPGSGASFPRTFLSSRGGDKTFGDVRTKRVTLGSG